MASKTAHYELTKPAYSDSADIAVINSNMDIIDEKLYEAEQGAQQMGNWKWEVQPNSNLRLKWVGDE